MTVIQEKRLISESGVVEDTAVQLGETFLIPDAEELSKPGYEFLYWNAYRTSDNTYCGMCIYYYEIR